MDYRVYRLSVREKIQYGAGYIAVFVILGKLFYDSWIAAFAGILFLPLLYHRKAGKLAKLRRENLSLEFKDFIQAFSASLKAGYSAENAMIQAGKDLAHVYGGETAMTAECRKIEKQLLNNLSPEELLSDFAVRSGQDEMKDFAAIFMIAKRSGGNMPAIIRNTSDIISEKIEVKREIQLLFAAKRMEQNIMNVVPVLIIGYVRLTTPDYFEAMYHNAFGICAMTICLLVYMFAYFLSEKIMEIEI